MQIKRKGNPTLLSWLCIFSSCKRLTKHDVGLVGNYLMYQPNSEKCPNLLCFTPVGFFPFPHDLWYLAIKGILMIFSVLILILWWCAVFDFRSCSNFVIARARVCRLTTRFKRFNFLVGGTGRIFVFCKIWKFVFCKIWKFVFYGIVMKFVFG